MEFSKRTVKQSGLSYNLFHQTRAQKPMESGNDNEYNNIHNVQPHWKLVSCSSQVTRPFTRIHRSLDPRLSLLICNQNGNLALWQNSLELKGPSWGKFHK